MDIPFSRKNNLKVAIIAIHGWKGNRSSMEHVANALNIKYALWTFIQGPYVVSDNEYSWFEGNEKEGWKYQESFDLLHQAILNLNKYKDFLKDLKFFASSFFFTTSLSNNSKYSLFIFSASNL